MPRLSAWLIRLAFLHLVAGAGIGAVMLANLGYHDPGYLRWLPLHLEMVLVGWLLQLPLGVGYWMLPRVPGGARGPRMPGWGGLVALNGGILVAGAGAPAPGRAMELLGVGLFVVLLWPRIRPYGGRPGSSGT